MCGFILGAHNVVEHRFTGTQHAPHIRVAELAVVPEDDVILQILNGVCARLVCNTLDFGKRLLEAVAAVDVHGS